MEEKSQGERYIRDILKRESREVWGHETGCTRGRGPGAYWATMDWRRTTHRDDVCGGMPRAHQEPRTREALCLRIVVVTEDGVTPKPWGHTHRVPKTRRETQVVAP